MFNFLKKGREFNKLAKSFNGMNIMIEDILPNLERNPNQDEFGETILVLAYIATRGVNDRLEENDISMMAKIIVPTIKRGYITVTYAYQLTVGKLFAIANLLEMDEQVNEIMDKGPAFYQLENTLPQEIINNI